MTAMPNFGGTNNVPELDIGQPGSARAAAGDAIFTSHVVPNPDLTDEVVHGLPQQNAAFLDVLGSTGSLVQWRGTLRTRNNAVLTAILADLNQYQHGSGRTNGVPTAPDKKYLSETQLTDYDGTVMSQRAKLVGFTAGQRQAISSGGTMTLIMPLTVTFRILD